jgi:predicted dehydrogenase
MAKVRIGFVGAGFMGQLAHIRSYALLRDECELVALAEPRHKTAEQVAARYGIPRVYRDHRELVESEQLDGIVAPQRYRYHAALLPELYPNVSHLFTEKPLALGASEGDRLATLARDSGCIHMLGYHRRSDPATREAKCRVDAWKETGEMGALRYVRICYSDGDWTANAGARLIDVGEEATPVPAEDFPEFADDEDVRWALAVGVDTLVHPLNLIRHFLGERYHLVFVHASGRLLVFESDSGIPITIEVTPYRLAVGFDEEMLIAFDRGYLRLRPAPSLAINRAGTLDVYREQQNGAPPELSSPQLPWTDPRRRRTSSAYAATRHRRSPTSPRPRRTCTSSRTSCRRGSGFRPRGRCSARNASTTNAPGRSG